MANSTGVSIVFGFSTKIGSFRELKISKDVVLGVILFDFLGRLKEEFSTILDIKGSWSLILGFLDRGDKV